MRKWRGSETVTVLSVISGTKYTYYVFAAMSSCWDPEMNATLPSEEYEK